MCHVSQSCYMRLYVNGWMKTGAGLLWGGLAAVCGWVDEERGWCLSPHCCCMLAAVCVTGWMGRGRLVSYTAHCCQLMWLLCVWLAGWERGQVSHNTAVWWDATADISTLSCGGWLYDHIWSWIVTLTKGRSLTNKRRGLLSRGGTCCQGEELVHCWLTRHVTGDFHLYKPCL